MTDHWQATTEAPENIQQIIDLRRHPIDSVEFRQTCRNTLTGDGALVMRGFLKSDATDAIRKEGLENQHLAYYCNQKHNIYLTSTDSDFDPDHVRNLRMTSSKGCITDDQIPANSLLRTLYESPLFKDFLCEVLEEVNLYPYADSLSSINTHYAKPGQELGWHFDNSAFAITLMIQEPEGGGVFEYVGGLRNADNGDMGYEKAALVLNGEIKPKALEMDAGALVLFRGRNALHRVTPVTGVGTRILVVLAYNTQPGVALSESARMTFYGRLA